MPLIRSLILKYASADVAKRIEAESRRWKLRCHCGHETDHWEIGLPRYKSYITWGKSIYARCPHCGVTIHRAYYDSDSTASKDA